MSYRLNVEDVDIDGALREAAEQVNGDTRLGFLKKAGLAGGTLMSGGAILSALAPSAFAGQSGLSGYGPSQHHHYYGRPPASFGPGDVGILNFALTLEYLEAAFYKGASEAGLALNNQGKAFLNRVTFDEMEHVAFLKAALGSKAVTEPAFNFMGTNKSADLFLKTSFTLENTGVHAYLGQVANIVSPKYLTAAGSIVTIEGRHAGVVGLLLEPEGEHNGELITPSGPFDTPETAKEILKAVEETGFIVPS